MHNNNIASADSQDLSAELFGYQELSTATLRKSYSAKYQQYYSAVAPSIGAEERAGLCGNRIALLATADFEQQRLEYGYFCGQRLCPMCAWRDSRRRAKKLAAMDAFLQSIGYYPILITLTVPNVDGDILRNTIRHINQSLVRLQKRKSMQALKNSVRRLEITYNAQTGQYHPHLHLLMYVTPNYKNIGYISHANLLKNWQECTRNYNITQVDIRKTHGGASGNQYIAELAKYIAKPADMLISQQVFSDFYNATKGTQAISYSGVCGVASSQYDAGALRKYIKSDDNLYIYRMIMDWHFGGYQNIDVQTLNTAEMARLKAEHQNYLLSLDEGYTILNPYIDNPFLPNTSGGDS